MNVEINRVFDAPREQVWEAWADPEQIAQWWGPGGFDTPVGSVEIDLRTGGKLHLSMVQADTGVDYPVRFDVLEAVEPELIVLFSPAQPEIGLTTDTTTRIEFADENGKTRMTLTDGPYEGPMGGMAQQGWGEQFDKLDQLLLGVAPDQR